MLNSTPLQFYGFGTALGIAEMAITVGTPGAAPRRADHRQPGRYPAARVPPGLPHRAAGGAAHHVWGQRGVQRRGRRGAGKVAGAEVGHVQGESEVGTPGGLERFRGRT